jgi:hypothetical protein
MNPRQKYITPLLTGVIVLCLSSCASLTTNRQSNNPGLAAAQTLNTPPTTQSDSVVSTSPQPAQETSVAIESLNFTQRQSTSIAQSIKTISLNIYRVDSQCQTLVPEKVAVPAGSLVTAAVGKVLQRADTADFDLVGYRVNVNPNSGVATVDLRRSPNSPRQFVSLSTCEQFALFGSLRKTLTGNSLLKIKDVRFTEQGAEIYL